MKRYASYFTYILIFISMNTISPALQARGFFDTLTDFFNIFSDNPPQHNTKYTLTRNQAENYIDLYIATLHNDLVPNASDYDIQRIREKTYSAFNHSSTVYVWMSGIRMYNKDMIDQFLLSAIIEVVEANTYNYAYSQTNNSTIAGKVTQTIRARLIKVVEKHTFDTYSLRPFFGYPLNQTILKEIALQHYYSTGPSGNSSHHYGTTGYTGYTGYTGRTGNTGSSGSTGYTGGWY